LLNNSRQLVGPFARRPGPQQYSSGQAEEVLVADARAHLTPADMVDRKLQALLSNSSLAVSCLRTAVPRDHGREVQRT
jgi:hypothetical protein